MQGIAGLAHSPLRSARSRVSFVCAMAVVTELHISWRHLDCFYLHMLCYPILGYLHWNPIKSEASAYLVLILEIPCRISNSAPCGLPFYSHQWASIFTLWHSHSDLTADLNSWLSDNDGSCLGLEGISYPGYRLWISHLYTTHCEIFCSHITSSRRNSWEKNYFTRKSLPVW